MLFSERQEREQRFKLALRATIPILALIGLVFYASYFKGGEVIDLNFENKLLIAAIVFISVYFIYFFLERSVKESLIDPATQSFTEKAFIEKVKQRDINGVALIIIDNLYLINQNYSTKQVNLLLHNFIHKLNDSLQEQGEKEILIGRRYGAEFLIGFNTQNDIESLLEQFAEHHSTIDGIELDYHFAVITNTDQDFEKAIEQLKNLILSEQNDSNDVQNKESIKDAQELSAIERTVVSALKSGNLSLSFRPLLNMKTNHIDTYEIAIKLKQPKGADILPRVYLPIINRMGMGREYDLLLVKHILKLLPLIDKHISLTFNLSPFSLRDKYFQDRFFSLLEKSSVEASRLIIQLYERKTHHNLSGYLRTLNQIRSHGVRICIDNFGSSNASMEYMKHFKFDMIQFDRDYVTKLDDKTSLAMLESLVKMSKELDITTVAKWVDKEDQKTKLKSLGIDYMQGFGIARPIDEYQLVQRYNKGEQ